MGSWQLIERTGETLVRLLQERIDVEFPPGSVSVQMATTASFADLRTTGSPVVTVMLYRVLENAERRNERRRVLPSGSYGRQPLALELCFLITPWGVRTNSTAAVDLAATREEHRLFGLILQSLYDHGEVGTARLAENATGNVWREHDGLQLMLESLSVEDQYRLFDASELSYRLSAAYRVRVAPLEPREETLTVPVETADLGATT